MKIKVPCTVVDKRRNTFLFGLFGSFHVTIRPESLLDNRPCEISVPVHQYHDLQLGETILVSFEKTVRDTYRLVQA